MSYFIDFSILSRNRNFALLYLGQLVSFLGTMITSVALPYQIYHLTHSTLQVGLLSLFQLLPLLITALLGGILADRHHRRTLLLITELLLAIGCLLMAFNARSATPQIWVIYMVASVMSGINGLHRPALDSLTQQLVEKKDLPAVGSLSSFMFSFCMIGGPALAGLIIVHLGLVPTFVIDFMTYFISLITVLLIANIPKPSTQVQSEQPRDSTWLSLKQGFRYAFSRQELVGTYVIDFTAMIFGMPTALFPAIAQSLGGVKTLGLLYSAPAVGALLLTFVSGWTKHIRYHGRAIGLAAVLWGITMVGFGLSTNLWLALTFLALSGAFDAISGMFRSIMWNETIPSHFRGRLAGIEMLSYLSGPRLGDTEAGLVAAAFGVTASIVSGGVLCVIGVAVCCYFLPKFCNYESTKQEEAVDTMTDLSNV